MVLQQIVAGPTNKSDLSNRQSQTKLSQWLMAYRSITRDDFNQVLQSFGNDPAILTHEIGPDYLQNDKAAPWYINFYRNWMESNPLNAKLINQSSLPPIAFFVLGFIVLAGGIAYIAIQVDGKTLDQNRSTEVIALQKNIQQLQGELHDLDELLTEQHEELLIKLEEAQSKNHSKAKLLKTPAFEKLDLDEMELKKWRHLGVGKNNDGGHALLHDGQKTLMISKNQLLRGQWRLSEFNSLEAILVGPNGKRMTLSTQ